MTKNLDESLKNLIGNPRVQYIRVMTSDDCCPSCSKLEGAYQKDAVPELPVKSCSNALGCRCFYQPFLTEIYP